MINSQPSERIALLGTIDPDANAAATFTSDWCDMTIFHAGLAVIEVGTLGASATIDAKLEEATDSSGTDAQDLTGKSITQLTQAGSDSDKQALINLKSDELSATYTHVRISLTVGTATSDCSAVFFGVDPRYGPANDNDLASVDEIVT